MELLTREMKSDALYKMIVSKRALKEIIELMHNYRSIEKKVKLNEIDRLSYVVFADCLGDVLDRESSDAFFNSNIPNFLFVDPYSCTNQWSLIAHELIHSLQQYLYLFPQDNHYDDWTEVMARSLQEKVRDIICNESEKNMVFKFVTEDENKIDEFIDYKRGIVWSNDDVTYAFEDTCKIEYFK